MKHGQVFMETALHSGSNRSRVALMRTDQMSSFVYVNVDGVFKLMTQCVHVHSRHCALNKPFRKTV